MKKLKYSCLFYGHLFAVVFLLIPAVLIGFCIADALFPHDFVHAAVIASAISYPVLLTAFAVILRLPGAEDRAETERAVPLEWKSISTSLCSRLRSEENNTASMAILLLAMSAFTVIMLFLSEGPTTAVLIAAIVLLGGTLLLSLKNWLYWLFWHQTDYSAEYTAVKVHHSFRRVFLTNAGTHTVHYLVFYQPDGKYVVRYEGKGDPPDRFLIVRFRGKYRIIYEIW